MENASATDPVWAKEDLLKLLEAMRGNLPQNDTGCYRTTESRLCWDDVAFGSYSGYMCKQKWLEMSQEVRKFRTLSELIVDAEENVKTPPKGRRMQKHPDFPKKPVTAYLRFFMEKRAKYAKLYPQLSNMDLTKVLSRKYRELPAHKKAKYVQAFQRDKEDFDLKVLKFREKHPDPSMDVKHAVMPEKAKTPQQLWYTHKKKSILKAQPDMSYKDIRDMLGRQWSQLSDKKRLKWINKSLEQQRLYEESMHKFILQHPEMNLSEGYIKKNILTKAERRLKDKSNGRPEKPPVNGYTLFFAEQLSGIKDIPYTKRVMLCSQQWKKLTQSQRDEYHQRCEQRKREYASEMDRFLLSLPKEDQLRVLGEVESLGLDRKCSSSSSSPSAQAQSGLQSSGRPISALFIFSEEKKPRLLRERPELSESELMSELALMWDELPAKKKEKYERLEATLKAEMDKAGKHEPRPPDPPRTAQEVWQLTVFGDYMTKFNNDRTKAEEAMKVAWSRMNKRKKSVWVKMAAEDHRRHEREIGEIRSLPTPLGFRKQQRFEGEPKKPPLSGYHVFSQEVLVSKELGHLPLKDRMGEVGARWKRLPQREKDRYKEVATTIQEQYKEQLDRWLKSLSSDDQAAYAEYKSTKRKRTAKTRGSKAKMPPAVIQKPDSDVKSEEEEEEEDDDDDDDDDEKENEKESSSEESCSSRGSNTVEKDAGDTDEEANGKCEVKLESETNDMTWSNNATSSESSVSEWDSGSESDSDTEFNSD